MFAIGSIAALAGAGSGVTLPALQMQSLDGRPVSLASYAGRPTVVNLWASWCGPCRREMPLLQQAQQAAPEIEFVFLNQGETPTVINDFLSQQRIVLRNVLVDDRLQAGSAFGQRALPTTLFFDARGRLVSTRIGELSAATLEQRLAELRPGRAR